MDNQQIIDQINQMAQIEIAHLWGYAPAGNSYFDRHLSCFEIDKRFEELDSTGNRLDEKE